MSPDGMALVVLSGTAPPMPVHPLWLRERCTEAASVDAITGQRLYNPADLDAHLAIVRIDGSPEAGFTVTFSDGCAGTFAAADILAELPDAAACGTPAPAAWSTAAAPPPPVDWPACDNDRVRLRVLHDFLVHGYVILRHVPAHPGAVLDVARRFGFPRETNFGAVFDVQSVPGATDLAYTSLHLDPHTDNPYRAPVPGIQLLHCLTNQTPGGLSTLVDGLAVAEALRATAPDDFASLSRTPVRFRYADEHTDLAAHARLIELDAAANFAAMHYSPRLDFVPLLPAAELELFFSARRRLAAMLKSSTFERQFRLDDGDLMMFDNRRLLHGRTGFDPRAGLRHLQGCYIDSDGPRSQYRVLQRRLS